MDRTEHVVSLFLEVAEHYSDRPAITHWGKTVTYGVLERDARRLVRSFHEQGVRPGNQVVVFMGMSIELYTVIIALTWLGATVVFIDTWSSKDRLAQALKIAHCQRAVIDRRLRWIKPFHPALRLLPALLSTRRAQEAWLGRPYQGPNGRAIITFTTGSTGQAKGAVRTHAFLLEQLAALERVIPVNRDRSALVSLPVVLLMNLATGQHSCIPDVDPQHPSIRATRKLRAQLEREHVKRLIASPELLVRIAAQGKLSTIEEVFTGGGPVFPNDANVLIDGFPNATVVIIYGSTEAEPISTILAKEVAGSDAPLLPVGKLTDVCELRIFPISDERIAPMNQETFEAQCASVSEVGEIVVSGPHVLTEYTDQNVLLVNKIQVEGKLWHRTGDAGMMDRHGSLYLAGRCAERMEWNEAGRRIIHYPFSVALLAQSLDGVADLVLVSVADGWQAVWSGDPAQASAVKEMVLRQWPFVRRVHWMKALPKDSRHRTKVDIERLRHQLARR